MPLIYSFVSRGNTVLADYTSYTGNFSTVALQVRGRAPRAGRPINAGAALLRQRGRPAGPCPPRQRLRGVIGPWPARQPPAPRRWARVCRRRHPPLNSALPAAALQALEKGAQGANAKFTYSCDGHSELRALGSLLAAGKCAAVQTQSAQLQPPQPPANRRG